MAGKGTYRGGGTLLQRGGEWFGGAKGSTRDKRYKALQKRLKKEAAARLKEAPLAGAGGRKGTRSTILPKDTKMTINVAELSDAELENLIANHRRLGATDRPQYLDALEERARRRGSGLAFKKSFAIIRAAAAQKRFLSYKDLADASGVDWGQAHYKMGAHLWDLVEYAHRMHWPMLSSIVVNKANLADGSMEPDTLKGFITAARELGYSITDEHAFLKEQQQLVFSWAAAFNPMDRADQDC